MLMNEQSDAHRDQAYKSCDNCLSLEPVILYHSEYWDVIRYVLAFHDCLQLGYLAAGRNHISICAFKKVTSSDYSVKAGK